MKLVMIGPIPEPYTGQSICFKKLMDDLSTENELEVFHVDTSPKRSNLHVTGKFAIDRFFETFSMLLCYIKILLKESPDVTYLTKGSTTLGFIRDFSFLVSKLLLCKRSIFVVHLKGGNYDIFYHDSSFCFKYFIRLFLKKVDKIIVLGNSLIKMYDFIPVVSDKISVVENALTLGIDVSRNVEISSCNSKKVFIFLSNLIYSKGFLHVAEAAQHLNRKGVKNFELLFAGEFMSSPDDLYDINDCKSDFLDIISKNDNISYLGSVTGIEKTNLLLKADALFLPTNYHVEGQPNCIIEAMSFSCAIVSTEYRSIPDLMDSSNGFYVSFGDVDSLAGIMLTLIEQPELLVSMQKSSHDKYREKFTWDVHYRKMLNILLK
ncbi:glycosyltransferase [Vibrio vulnificus]|nr:glycosyltransferase [Vibrio vulnificus]